MILYNDVATWKGMSGALSPFSNNLMTRTGKLINRLDSKFQ